MIKKIRKGIFETNSSSSHAITFNKEKEGIITRLPGNYLLKLTDEFSTQSFSVDYIGDGDDRYQSPEQKIQYLYVYCAWYPKLFKLFKQAVAKYADRCNIIIDFDQEQLSKLTYYNIARDYLYDEQYIINHESSDMLEKTFEGLTDEKIINKMVDIMEDSRYTIFNDDYISFE